MNFIAFRFCDNDFHSPLRQAIEYVVEHRRCELSLAAFHEHVLRAMVAFNSIRGIDEYSLTLPDNDYAYYRKYFEKTLRVIALNSIDELDADTGFEGYIYDHNTFQVYYRTY